MPWWDECMDQSDIVVIYSGLLKLTLHCVLKMDTLANRSTMIVSPRVLPSHKIIYTESTPELEIIGSSFNESGKGVVLFFDPHLQGEPKLGPKKVLFLVVGKYSNRSQIILALCCSYDVVSKSMSNFTVTSRP